MSDQLPVRPVHLDSLCHLPQEHLDQGNTVVALLYVYGSWNPPLQQTFIHEKLSQFLQKLDPPEQVNAIFMTGAYQVDQTDDSMAYCIGDDDCYEGEANSGAFLPCPPEILPVLAVSVQKPSNSHAQIGYLSDISPPELMSYLNIFTKKEENAWLPLVASTISNLLSSGSSIFRSVPNKRPATRPSTDGDDTAIRIFVAGDRSSVGKSSVCLGLLGNLMQRFGYEPSSLAYIKPATQCEAPQLVQKYCDSFGIACVPVGPLVYYKGFTRAFLAGETGQTTEDLLQECGEAVDKIARGKKVVLVDGVGFPAVGSICGTDNASVSKACGYPQPSPSTERSPMGVIVVGGSGVGAAVDAFNLNATYFEMQQIPVMGGIFNKLSTEGFYSLENCRTQVTRYFDQNEHQQEMGRKAFGFVPQFPSLSDDNAMSRVDDFLHVFVEHVDIKAILNSAIRIKNEQSSTFIDIDSPAKKQLSNNGPPPKRAKLNGNSNSKENSQRTNRSSRPELTRRDIERMAAQQGAAPMA